jgi:N-acetylneuraminic acid mutarotase
VDDSKGSPLNSQITIYDRQGESWRIVDDPSSPRPGNFAAFSISGTAAYIFGGESAHSNATADAFSYELTQGKWTPLSAPETLIPRKQATLTPVGNELILWGGNGPSAVTNWGRFDTITGRWSIQELPAGMPSRVSHSALALDQERLFIWGGFVDQERRGDGFILNIRSGEIVSIPDNPLLPARANARAVLIGDEVFIWGGSPVDGPSQRGAVLQLKDLQWRQLPAIPDQRFEILKGAEIAALGRQGFFLFGGRFGSEAFNDQLWYLDARTSTWTLIRTDESPPGRMAHCFVALSPNFYAVFGGIGYEKDSQSLTQFDGLWLLEL